MENSVEGTNILYIPLKFSHDPRDFQRLTFQPIPIHECSCRNPFAKNTPFFISEICSAQQTSKIFSITSLYSHFIFN